MTEFRTDSVLKAFQPGTGVRWRLVAILMGFSGLNHFHRQSLPAVVDEVMRDCRLTETDMGWIYSARQDDPHQLREADVSPGQISLPTTALAAVCESELKLPA